MIVQQNLSYLLLFVSLCFVCSAFFEQRWVQSWHRPTCPTSSKLKSPPALGNNCATIPITLFQYFVLYEPTLINVGRSGLPPRQQKYIYIYIYIYGLWNPEVQCRIHKGSTITPILSRINSITRNDTYLFKVHSNIVLPSTPCPPQMSLSCKFKIEIKSVAYSSQRSDTGQLDFCN